VTVATAVLGEERVTELSRMLSGHPGSDAARAHARELLGVGEGAPASA
jgi:DNA repair ATPase RecN